MAEVYHKDLWLSWPDSTLRGAVEILRLRGKAHHVAPCAASNHLPLSDALTGLLEADEPNERATKVDRS